MSDETKDDDEEVEESDAGPAENPRQRAVRLVVRVAVVVGLILVAIMVLRLYPHELPVKDDPGFVDVIFASRGVVAATRAVIVFAAIYAVLSMVILGWRGHWMTTFVGVQTGKVERSVTGLDAEVERLTDALKDAKDTIRTLEDELANTTEELERVARERDEARAARDNSADTG